MRELVEDGGAFVAHRRTVADRPRRVDGTLRTEARLTRTDAAGAAVTVLRWVGPVLSALPQLAPLDEPSAPAPGAGPVLWTLAVAGATWGAVWLGLLLVTSIRPPVLAGAGLRVTGHSGRQRALVAAQVAVSAVLVISAGLLLRSAHGVASIPRGFVPEGVLVAQLHTAGYTDTEGHVFYRRLLDAVRDGGPVTSAALAWHTPFSEFTLSISVEIPGTSLQVLGNAVSADYFRTFGVAVLEGREFTAADHTDSPLVAMVNRTLAERLWPDRLAVGQVLTFPRSGGDRTVIRVAIGAREASLRWMVLAEGLRLVAVGALVGLAAAVPLTRLLESQLYGIAPHDAATLAGGLLGLLAAGALTCDLPARRAAHLDTAAALRSQ